MVHVAVYGEDLAANTSSIPSREMLRRLVRMRACDRFTFVVCRHTQVSHWWQAYSGSLPDTGTWGIHPLRNSRRAYNIKTLLGARHQPDAGVDADLYLRFDAGTMGRHRTPLVNLIADLSALRLPETTSLNWHGRALFRQALKDGAEVAARTVCISAFTQADVADALPELAPRLAVIRNGISDEWLHSAEAPTHSRVPRPTARPYFIWYGGVTPRKNIPGLIEGYAGALLTSGPSFPDLVIVGAGSHHTAHVIDQIRKCGLDGRVLALPPQPLPVLVALVSESSGLAFPSFFEGFGMPIVEAFARGVPVLTSNVSATAEIADGHAELCDPTNIASIRDGLIRLACPDQVLPVRAAQRRNYAAQFTAVAAARAYSALIDDVLSGDCTT